MSAANVIEMPVSYTADGSEVHNMASLADKTMFLFVRFGMLGNSRKVSGSEVLETDADKALLKVSKLLLDSEELEAIKKADGKMRQFLYNSCLPFEAGVYLLPDGMAPRVNTRLTEYKAERSALVSKFVAAYPELCKSAAKRLGSLYNVADYPNAEVLASKFAFSWRYRSFGVPSKLQGFSAAMFEEEKEKAASDIANATEAITTLMRQSLLEMTAHLQERLTTGDDGKQKILRESAVKNVQEFLSTFELRNVTNDKELSAIVAKAKALISGTNAEALRSNEGWRETVRDGMAAITAQLGTLVETKSGRKYREE